MAPNLVDQTVAHKVGQCLPDHDAGDVELLAKLSLGGQRGPHRQFALQDLRAQRIARVVVVDLRGIGGSTPTESGYDVATVAEDVHQLARTLDLERFYVVGHDVGLSRRGFEMQERVRLQWKQSPAVATTSSTRSLQRSPR